MNVAELFLGHSVGRTQLTLRATLPEKERRNWEC